MEEHEGPGICASLAENIKFKQLNIHWNLEPLFWGCKTGNQAVAMSIVDKDRLAAWIFVRFQFWHHRFIDGERLATGVAARGPQFYE